MAGTRFVTVDGRRAIENDWYPGSIPDNVRIDPTAYVGSSYGFSRFRSEHAEALTVGRGATLGDATLLDVGPRGRVRIGEYALITAARIVCDGELEIGDRALISWDTLLMDSYRVPFDPDARRRALRGEPDQEPIPVRPIRLGALSWIGFGACVLPGVTVGEGAIVAARSVVAEDVPAYVLVAGNPARIVRALERDERARP
jgi:acetyltransferase-like isoleucine patch superfamily enzyme